MPFRSFVQQPNRRHDVPAAGSGRRFCAFGKRLFASGPVSPRQGFNSEWQLAEWMSLNSDRMMISSHDAETTLKLGGFNRPFRMGKRQQEAKAVFAVTADLLAREVVIGKWDHLVPNWSCIPVEEWGVVVMEFALRCPGHAELDYVAALRRSLWNNR